MKKCINECCGRPNCDIAYQLNGHCYSVECSDGKLCQATNEPTREGDNIQLAYMNKNGLNEKQRGNRLMMALLLSILIDFEILQFLFTYVEQFASLIFVYPSKLSHLCFD